MFRDGAPEPVPLARFFRPGAPFVETEFRPHIGGIAAVAPLQVVQGDFRLPLFQFGEGNRREAASRVQRMEHAGAPVLEDQHGREQEGVQFFKGILDEPSRQPCAGGRP